MGEKDTERVWKTRASFVKIRKGKIPLQTLKNNTTYKNTYNSFTNLKTCSLTALSFIASISSKQHNESSTSSFERGSSIQLSSILTL